MENEIPKFRCYYCSYAVDKYPEIIDHLSNLHPTLDIKYRRRELKYRTKCFLGYKQVDLNSRGLSLCILNEKEEKLTITWINQTVVNVSTPERRSTCKKLRLLSTFNPQNTSLISDIEITESADTSIHAIKKKIHCPFSDFSVRCTKAI